MPEEWAGQCVQHVGKNSSARDPILQLDVILLISNVHSELIQPQKVNSQAFEIILLLSTFELTLLISNVQSKLV